MKALRDLSITWKLNLLIVAISAAVLLLASVVFVVQYRTEYEKNMVDEALALAEVICFSSAPALLFDDHAAGAQTLAALGANKNIAAAFIYDRNGALFCSLNPKNLHIDPPATTPQEEWHYFDSNYLHLLHSIDINNGVVGTIYMLYRMDQLQRRQLQYELTAGGIFLLCFVLTMFLSFFFQRIITQPLLALIAAVRTISHEKNYSLRVEKKTGDEIGALIDGFNEMVQEVQSRDLYLEDKVTRRTAELKTANENLVAEMQERLKIEGEREALITELRMALDEVKTLSGLLPICCSCKKIRTDEGAWLQIESYVQEHSNAEFSHGICPECAKKLYPDFTR